MPDDKFEDDSAAHITFVDEDDGLHEGLEGSALTYPVWKYVAVVDAASRPWHAARNGNYYPAGVPFEQVRGTTPADTEHCRCKAVLIDRRAWAELEAQGARLLAG